jgi:MFS family permease
LRLNLYNEQKISIVSILIFCVVGVFYLYEFFIRVSMGTIEPFVRSSLNFSPSEIALISSAFSLAYVLMQIPVGILFDKFGFTKSGFIGILSITFGCLLFSLALGFYSAWFARFIMGVGAAFALLIMLNVSILYFPKKIHGLMTGLTSIFGIIGPILAGGPLAYILSKTDNNWSLVFKDLAIFGLVFAFVFLLVNYFLKPPINKIEKTQPKISLLEVFSQRQLLKISAFGFFIYASIELFGSLYGTNYMVKIGYSHTTAATLVSFVWLGMGIGAPIIGIISDILKNRKIVLSLAALLGVISTLLVVYGPDYGSLYYIILYFLLGVAAGSQALTFSVVADISSKSKLGVGVAFTNMFIILGVVVIQITAGTILSFICVAKDSHLIYSLGDYQVVLSLSSIFFLIAFLISIFFIKETHSRNKYRELVNV